MKKFIGGYYKENLDVEHKGLAFTEVLVLTLEDALDHPAMEFINVAEFYDDYKEDGDLEFCQLSDNKKIQEIEDYIQDDEIFGGRFYEDFEVEKIVKEFTENAKLYED